MPIADRPELERFRYWQGQTLRSRDFNDQLTLEAHKRWWHNRALHDAYGVVAGLEVSTLVDSNGERRFEVSPGLAYDCFGRELCLKETKLIDAPPSEPVEPRGFTLLLRHDDPHVSTRERQPLCADRGIEGAELVWKPTRLLTTRDGVALTRGRFDGSFRVERGFRQLPARPLARPHVGSGATVQGKTPWRPWRIVMHVNRPPAGIEVTIDTTSAGFTAVPCYFAWLQGELWRERESGFVPLLVDRIRSATIGSFVFRLFNINRLDPRLLPFARRELFVCWLGIQMQDGAGP